MKNYRSLRQPLFLLSTAVLPAINIICFLLVLTILSNTFGPLDYSLVHLVSIYLVIGILLLNLPLIKTCHSFREKNQNIRQLLAGVLILVCAVIIFMFTAIPFLWIASIPLLITGLDLTLLAQRIQRKELRLLAITSFGYALLFLLIQTIPPLWYVIQQISLLSSSTVGMLINAPLLLGPTTSGVWIVLVCLVFIGTTFLITPRKTRHQLLLCIGWKIGILLAWILFLILLAIVPFESNQDAVKLQYLMFLFCLIPTFLFFAAYRLHTFNEEKTTSDRIKIKKLFKNGATWAVLFLILSSILLTIFLDTSNSSSEHPKVVFYGQHMLGTWDIPAYGTYGRDAAGMFGLLPIYLTADGYETEIIVENRTTFLNVTQPHYENITRYVNLTDYTSIVESPEVTTALLTDARIFVITNLNASFSTQEQKVIWEFVENGGSLLVLGDHTNVGGLQTPLNDVLAPVGIQFRFDAALPLDQTFKWTTCSQILHHPSAAYLTSLDELQISVGASLNISLAAEPVIIGTYALSDNGNHSNPEMAYLGDYNYNKGEQLGDVILVASAYYGKGKVLVFGDTSSFQNTALPSSYQFLHRIFTWLNSTQTGTIKTLQISVALLFLISAIFAFRFFNTKRVPFAVFPLAFCTALLLSTLIQPILMPPPMFNENIVCIDASHAERYNIELFTDESLTGLMLNLNRNNYLPIIEREFTEETISKSSILFFNAPTKSFSPDEITFLHQYMTNGGFIVLATGFEDKGASLPLLSELNLGIEATPLGPIPYVEGNTTEYQNEPRFVDSWPITFDENQAISYYNFTWNQFTYHLVVLIKQGKGGLLLISDSQYFLDKNIESIYDYWPGNIIFLKQLLTEIRTMEEQR